jgi:hypothetical protein
LGFDGIWWNSMGFIGTSWDLKELNGTWIGFWWNFNGNP